MTLKYQWIMIKHVVLFKLKAFDSDCEKQAKMNEIKIRLESLIQVIPELKKIHVGLNINPAEKWDVILETEFASLKDLDTYANHPDHVAISKNLIAPVKEDRACVDFM